MRSTRVLAALLLVAAASPSAAWAQDKIADRVELKDGTGIARDAATYRLTRQVLPRFGAALHQVAGLQKSDPAAMAGGPGEVSDNTAEYPILNENIRFVKANAAALKAINANIASMMGDSGATK